MMEVDNVWCTGVVASITAALYGIGYGFWEDLAAGMTLIE
jgi:hypothetical protein